MADNNLDIYIRLITQQTGEKPEAVLAKLKDATKQVGQEAVKQEEEVTAATDKTFTSKKQLKDMLKQLSHEFPLLGAAGRLALNPIVGVTAGITAAWQIWKYRNDELAKSFGALKLPEVSEDYISRLDRFAEKLKKVADQSAAAASKLKETQDTIDANADFWKALGVDVGTGPARAKADAATAAATQLLASGRAKSDSGVAVTPEDLAKAKAMADAAQQDNIERQNRLSQIGDMEALGRFNPKRLYYDNVFRARYGYGTSYAQAADIERGAMANNNNTIGFYSNLTARAALRSSGNAEISQAQEILGQNVGARRDIATQTASQLAAAVSAFDPQNLATIGPKFTQIFVSINDLLKRIDEAQKELARKQAAQNQRP